MSRSNPRGGKYAKLFLAVVAFAVYYNAGAMAKTWVEQGVVGSIPGIWWVPAALGLFVAWLLLRSDAVGGRG